MEYKKKLFIDNEWIDPCDNEFINTGQPCKIPRGKLVDINFAAESGLEKIILVDAIFL